MHRRRALLLSTALVLIGSAWLFWPPHPATLAHPSLCALLVELDTPSGPGRANAADSLRKLGTNALPVLLDLLRTNNFSQLRERPRNAERSRAILEAHQALECGYRQAVSAFEILGPQARPAIPALIELLNRPETAAPAAQALAVISSEAWHPLTNALAGREPECRAAAASALGYLRCEASPLVPLLTAGLGDTAAPVRYRAVVSLTRLGPVAAPAIPGLIGCLADADAGVRQKAAVALRLFGSQAQAGVPALLKALADPDDQVRESAEETLKVVDPKAATAAAIK